VFKYLTVVPKFRSEIPKKPWFLPCNNNKLKFDVKVLDTSCKNFRTSSLSQSSFSFCPEFTFFGVGSCYMIRKPMDTHNQVATSDTESSGKTGRDKMSTSTNGPIFRLEDQTSKWGGTKIWTLVFDLPGEKVNKLSRAVMQEVESLLPQLESLGAQGKVDALILMSGKPGNFIAGADIEMIQSAKNSVEAENLSKQGQKLMNRWEDLSFPTIAAIDGAALGGGCEFALACSAIVMSSNPAAKIGLPEVMLGLIPGMGGCVRLPRKVGLATALDMILASKTLNSDRAYKSGLIEASLPKENFHEAVQRWTKLNLEALQSGRRLAKEPKLGGMGGPIGSLLEKTPMKSVVFKKAREGVLSKTKGHYPAPLEALDVVQETAGAVGERAKGKERERAMDREAHGFGKMAATEISKNLIRLFFLTEGVKKSKGLPPGTQAKEHKIGHAAALGAGIMGGGIAQLFADKMIPTRMKDLNAQALSIGVQSASKIFKKKVQQKRISQREYLQKLNMIAPVVDYTGFQSVDIVVEAIVENLDVKKKVFSELETYVKPNCIVASNTSSLSISKMQTALKNPERFVGMHFFNPVNKMPLIEVIRGEKTSDEAVSAVFQFSKQLGKTPIVVKDAPGFLVNRLLAPYLNEAVFLLADGAPIPEIDQVLVDFGMPMGPLELIDEVGVDVAEKVAHILHEGFGDRMTPASLHQKVVNAGRLGKKNGKGLYQYEGPKKTKELDPEIYTILGITPKDGALSEEEIVDRCILTMINEASRCLEEGIVSSAAEVDLGMIMGTGFPPFRGGLLRYADTLGAKTIVERLKKYQSRVGARFEPAPALVKRAENGQRFYSN
jgi:3-hydroxyacyl-CoA dehydrogenase/enoyl-CoA hydratase/3-hydroxybutyryl-CoA epimerase